MANTYTKLKSGAWGVRIEGASPAVGASVSVRKKDGSVKTERIEAIVWRGSGVTLCAIGGSTATAQPRRSYSNESRPPRGQKECDECGDFVTPGTRCWETGCVH